MLIDSRCRGNVILELAIILPLLCLLGLTSVEFSLAMNRMQIATALSRELAASAYRECIADQADLTGASADVREFFDPQTCISGFAGNFLARIQTLAPDAEFYVTVLTYDSSGGGSYSRAAAGRLSYNAGGTAPATYEKSRYKDLTPVSDASSSLAVAAREYGTVVIGEIFVAGPGLFGRVFPAMNLQPRSLYAVTIL